MKRGQQVSAPKVDERQRTRIRRAVLVSTCLSGAAALIYEVAWTRELSLVFGSTVYAVSMMLAAFMSGLSLGGVIGGRMADRGGLSTVRRLAFLEFGIGFFGILSIPLIRMLPGLYFSMHRAIQTPGWTFFIVQLALSFIVMLVPTTLMGATFPIVSRVNIRSTERMGQAVGDAYSLNTLGSIGGSISAGFLLVPLLGVKGAIFAAATLNIVVAAALLLVLGEMRWRKGFATAVTGLMIVTAVGLASPRAAFTLGFPTMSRYATYADYELSLKETDVLFYEENASGRVAVTERGGYRTLRNGGFIEGSDDPSDRGTNGLLAALPFAYTQNPSDALVIGLGTGYTTQMMLGLPLEHVDTVEINPAVADASEYFVGRALTDDPRWTLHIDDARQYLLEHEGAYDIISSEPSWPLTESVAHLFTREFFELAEQSLDEGGVIVQWLPAYLLEEQDVLMMYRTFESVFPGAYVWSSQPVGSATDLFLIGVKEPTESKTQEEASERAKGALGALGVEGVPLTLYASPETFAEDLASTPAVMNTDDRPLLEFRVIESLVEQLEQPIM